MIIDWYRTHVRVYTDTSVRGVVYEVSYRTDTACGGSTLGSAGGGPAEVFMPS